MIVTSAPLQNTRLMRTLAVLRDVVSRPSGAIGLFLVVFHVVLAMVSPWIVPYDYKAMTADGIDLEPYTKTGAPSSRYEIKRVNEL